TDPRQFRDREVQLHKSIAILLVIVGIIALRRGRTASDPANPHPRVSAASHQAKMVAVMALIGGGMLFTHVHTVAPYANVAAGVYINHVAMGLVALAIGAAKLWGRRKLLFPALLGLEAFFLITYTEGLPLFIGIGHYNRWG